MLQNISVVEHKPINSQCSLYFNGNQLFVGLVVQLLLMEEKHIKIKQKKINKHGKQIITLL